MFDFTIFGSKLKVTERNKTQEENEKEAFINIVSSLEKAFTQSEKLLKYFQIDLSDYEDNLYLVIEDLISLHYPQWKAELIMWYIYDRKDYISDDVYPLMYAEDDKEEEKMYIKSPEELWEFLTRIDNKTSEGPDIEDDDEEDEDE
jgi:hypothetical protein